MNIFLLNKLSFLPKIARFNNPLIFFFLFHFFCSCVPYKDIVYLQSKKAVNDTLIVNNLYQSYKVQPGDILDIKFSAPDPQSVAIFNKEVGDMRPNQVNEASIFLYGYSVSDSGNINLPIIGEIAVQKMTVQTIKDTIEQKMKGYYKFSSVDVKLMNFRVTILGEVNHQGTFIIYREQANIIQALGYAGGLTDLSNKRRIKIIRNIEGQSKVIYVNLNNLDILRSEYYFIKPNDIIYVEPMKVKTLRVNGPTISIIISAITLLIVLTNLVKK